MDFDPKQSNRLPPRDKWGMPTCWDSGRPMGIYRPRGSFMLPFQVMIGRKLIQYDLAMLQQEAGEW